MGYSKTSGLEVWKASQKVPILGAPKVAKNSTGKFPVSEPGQMRFHFHGRRVQYLPISEFIHHVMIKPHMIPASMYAVYPHEYPSKFRIAIPRPSIRILELRDMHKKPLLFNSKAKDGGKSLAVSHFGDHSTDAWKFDCYSPVSSWQAGKSWVARVFCLFV